MLLPPPPPCSTQPEAAETAHLKGQRNWREASVPAAAAEIAAVAAEVVGLWPWLSKWLSLSDR